MHYIKISNEDWAEKERELQELREQLERKELENQLMKAELEAVRIRNNAQLARVQRLQAELDRLYDFCHRSLHRATGDFAHLRNQLHANAWDVSEIRRAMIRWSKARADWGKGKLRALEASEWGNPNAQ